MKVRAFTLALLASLPAVSPATPVVRSATADSLNVTTAWIGDPPTLPTTSNTATWDAASTLTNTLGANLTWGALNTSAASGAVVIAGASNLLLDHTTDTSTVLATGANNFTWGATPPTGGTFHINGAPGNASTAQGATFSGSGTVTIGGTGTKNWSTNASTNGVTHINFTGTLALRGAAIPAVGTLPGNWLALGGGGGDLANPGATAQTGSFALDLGDDTSCGAFILTQGFNSQALKLHRLSGTGSIRADWGIGAPLSNRSIELDQADDTTLSGSLLAHNGSGQRRNVHFVKMGSGTLTLAGALGTSGGTASLTFDLQGGKVQLGTGGGTPTFVGGLDSAAATFAVGSGTELVFKRAGSFTWPFAHSGAGTIRLQEELGNIAFTGNSAAFTGNVIVEQGSLRIGPSLGAGTLTAKSGTYLAVASAAARGTSLVGGLVLEDGSESDFRIGTTHDKLVITATGGLTIPEPGGTHTINVFNEPVDGGTITLIDYEGNALTEAEFARFELGELPLVGGFQLVNNTANTSIDLQITLQDQLWKGFTDGNWDDFTPNWALESTPALPAAFSEDHPAVFDDTASRFAVVVDEFGVFPLSVTFNNTVAQAYTFTGGPIAGPSALEMSGSGTVTLAQGNSYTGGTTVHSGIIRIGAGGETGDIGSGPVTVAQDATLAYDLDASQLRDYKTTPKMRNVSGAGNITLDGGFTFFNYTGSGVGFDDPNSWNNFSGTLTVKGNSEFRTIRNGRTAMGSAQVVLGDATSSGHLAQVEGNWTWTNPIQLVGAANEIRNRSANAPRTLKLQGAISGSGGLAFTDPAASMTDNQRGFILTGTNTLDGTITINPGVPVRVGGVPGDADINQSGAGTGGTLGNATVLNEGTLTFSRSDAHAVANNISGGGAVFVGLSTDNTEQEMTYSGTATHGGGTTVRAGTLTIAPAGSIGGSTLTVANSATLIIDGSSIGDTTSLNLATSALVDVTGTEVVDTLFIDNIQMPAGTYGTTGSGAQFPDDTRFTGSGVVQVTTGPAPTGYTGWAATHAPTGGPADDYDSDGVPNAVEYILGGTKDANDLGKLPQPDVSGGSFLFRFVRDQTAMTPDVTVTIEVTTDLADWSESYPVATAPEVATTDNGNGTETVTLAIPRGPGGRMFARLRVDVD